MKKKILLGIVVFLLLGLYVDIRNAGEYCNSSVYQKTVVVQAIVPFRVDRETFLFGYGDKQSLYPVANTEHGWYNNSDGSKDTWSSKYSCLIRIKDNKPYYGEMTHYFDLRFWEKAR